MLHKLITHLEKVLHFELNRTDIHFLFRIDLESGAFFNGDTKDLVCTRGEAELIPAGFLRFKVHNKGARSFVVNFEPKEAGWYKLRFSSRTNKILGVSIKEGAGFEIDPEEKVNIGTVQLKVKDLLKVRDQLVKHTEGLPSLELARTDLDAFDQKLDELTNGTDDINEKSRIGLYGAIIKLTTPGIKTENAFKQNQGEIEFLSLIHISEPTRPY